MFASSWALPLLVIGIFSSNSFATVSQWYSNAVCPVGYICCFSDCATTLPPAPSPYKHLHTCSSPVLVSLSRWKCFFSPHAYNFFFHLISICCRCSVCFHPLCPSEKHVFPVTPRSGNLSRCTLSFTVSLLLHAQTATDPAAA